ncbi:MAG TPA: ABC transporter substrate-binding protein [Ktedonobacterales bacterium]|nr:ABC transporter substrate-binding protein [Ktedonobacterales bacterium]
MSPIIASPRRVRLAPDWLPNTNHIGFYVAQAKGYYADEGLYLEILPFDGEAMPNRKIVTGDTEFGLMPQQSILTLRARGVDVVSVAALIQPNTTTLAVRADSGITRPRELAGRRYASYGTEFEVAMIEAMIVADGGTGAPARVDAEKLDILPALFDGTVDIAWGFYAWEGIQAELRGQALRHFFVAEHGVPKEYFPLLFTTQDYASRESSLVRAFARATGRGYAEAAAHPSVAAELFLASAPTSELPDAADALVRRSMTWLAPRMGERAQRDGVTRPWGWHDEEMWATFAAFARRLAAEHGLTSPAPDAETAGYTNGFVR